MCVHEESTNAQHEQCALVSPCQNRHFHDSRLPAVLPSLLFHIASVIAVLDYNRQNDKRTVAALMSCLSCSSSFPPLFPHTVQAGCRGDGQQREGRSAAQQCHCRHRRRFGTALFQEDLQLRTEGKAGSRC